MPRNPADPAGPDGSRVAPAPERPTEPGEPPGPERPTEPGGGEKPERLTVFTPAEPGGGPQGPRAPPPRPPPRCRATPVGEPAGAEPAGAALGGDPGGAVGRCARLCSEMYRVRASGGAWEIFDTEVFRGGGGGGGRAGAAVARTDTQCGVTERGGELHLVFRGTENARDWLTNFKVWPRRCEYGGRIHAGFDEAWRSARAMLASRGVLERARRAGRVTVTGHSLGGALALLAAVHLATAPGPDGAPPAAEVRCVTFGAPRVGTAGFARAVALARNLRVERYTLPTDPVPRVPLCCGVYHHAKGAVPIRRAGCRGTAAPACPCCVDVSDHAVDVYVGLVEGLRFGVDRALRHVRGLLGGAEGQGGRQAEGLLEEARAARRLAAEGRADDLAAALAGLEARAEATVASVSDLKAGLRETIQAIRDAGL